MSSNTSDKNIRNRNRRKTRKIAMGGILAAMTVIALFIAGFGVGPNMSFYVLCSVFIMVMVADYGITAGMLVYCVAGIIGFFVMPDKFGIIAYGVGFGVYPVIKFLAEKVSGKFTHYGIKIVWFVVAIVFYYFLTKFLFFTKLSNLKHTLQFTALIAFVMFMIYDYILSLSIEVYYRRIKNSKDIKLSK